MVVPPPPPQASLPIPRRHFPSQRRAVIEREERGEGRMERGERVMEMIEKGGEVMEIMMKSGQDGKKSF